MDQSPLVKEQIDAGKDVIDAFHPLHPVSVALWLKESEAGEWYLYLASDDISGHNVDTAYGEVGRIARGRGRPWIDPFQIKLIGTEDPVAKAAVSVGRRYPGWTAARIHGAGSLFGDVPADQVYIYPLPTVAAA